MGLNERRTTERRKSPRQKSFLRGMLYFGNQRSAVDCLVRDISSDGARLIFADAVSTPDTFDLHIPQKDQTLRAQVQWRAGLEIGVLFPQDDRMAGDGGDLEARVSRLEAEISSLKRLVKKLKAEIGGSDPDPV